MEKCTQCKKTEPRRGLWKRYVSRYHDVEIQHYICPQCSVLSFPRFYILHEDTVHNNRDTQGNDFLTLKTKSHYELSQKNYT